jgi:hypothetical protein
MVVHLDEAARVDLEAGSLEPVGIGLGADEGEELADRAPRFGARGEVEVYGLLK